MPTPEFIITDLDYRLFIGTQVGSVSNQLDAQLIAAFPTLLTETERYNQLIGMYLEVETPARTDGQHTWKPGYEQKILGWFTEATNVPGVGNVIVKFFILASNACFGPSGAFTLSAVHSAATLPLAVAKIRPAKKISRNRRFVTGDSFVASYNMGKAIADRSPDREVIDIGHHGWGIGTIGPNPGTLLSVAATDWAPHIAAVPAGQRFDVVNVSVTNDLAYGTDDLAAYNFIIAYKDYWIAQGAEVFYQYTPAPRSNAMSVSAAVFETRRQALMARLRNRAIWDKTLVNVDLGASDVLGYSGAELTGYYAGDACHPNLIYLGAFVIPYESQLASGPAAPGFGVSPASPSALLAPGGPSVSISVSLPRYTGNPALTMGISGLPAGVVGTFLPNPVPAGTTATTLTLVPPLTNPATLIQAATLSASVGGETVSTPLAVGLDGVPVDVALGASDIDWLFEALGALDVSALSVEFLKLSVSARRGTRVVDPTEHPLEMAFVASPSALGTATWHSAEWDDSGRARLLIGPGHVELSVGAYYWYVRVASAPETTIKRLPSVLRIE